jgi:hypothetical protein
MTNLHNLHLGILDGADVAAIVAFSPEELAELQSQVNEAMGMMKKRSELLTAALDRKYGEAAQKMRVEEGKDTGIVHVLEGNFDIEAKKGKTVKWDQSKLIAALDAMPNDTAKHYAKTEFTVDEKKYSAAPPEIKKLLDPARSVVPGKATYIITPTKKDN